MMLAAIALLVAIPGSASRAGETCSAYIGQYVILKSNRLDPDVFVWDERARLVSYAAGEWKHTLDVLDHTILSKPGTRAFVISCEPEAVRFRYEQVLQDALGLKLVSGPQRGRYGWVAADDARTDVTAAYPASARRRPASK
jgi:hypothetical protein